MIGRYSGVGFKRYFSQLKLFAGSGWSRERVAVNSFDWLVSKVALKHSLFFPQKLEHGT